MTRQTWQSLLSVAGVTMVAMKAFVLASTSSAEVSMSECVGVSQLLLWTPTL